MNRNQHRLLSDTEIANITSQVAYDLVNYKTETAEVFIDHYLRGDAEGLFKMISEWIEIAEDEVKRQLNGDLMEDSFNDESFSPSYDF
jgi:hypothetical protein